MHRDVEEICLVRIERAVTGLGQDVVDLVQARVVVRARDALAVGDVEHYRRRVAPHMGLPSVFMASGRLEGAVGQVLLHSARVAQKIAHQHRRLVFLDYAVRARLCAHEIGMQRGPRNLPLARIGQENHALACRHEVVGKMGARAGAVLCAPPVEEIDSSLGCVEDDKVVAAKALLEEDSSAVTR